MITQDGVVFTYLNVGECDGSFVLFWLVVVVVVRVVIVGRRRRRRCVGRKECEREKDSRSYWSCLYPSGGKERITCAAITRGVDDSVAVAHFD